VKWESTTKKKPRAGSQVLCAWKADRAYYPAGWQFAVTKWTGGMWVNPEDIDTEWAEPDFWCKFIRPVLEREVAP
jgi:hypothetical protein